MLNLICAVAQPAKLMTGGQVKTRTQGAVAAPRERMPRHILAIRTHPGSARHQPRGLGEHGSSDHHSFVGALLLEEPSVVEVLGELLPRQRVRDLVGLALVRDPFVVDTALT